MHQLPIQIGDDHCCYTITNQHVSRKVSPAELRSMAVQTTLVTIRCLNESLLSKADPFCASEGQWGRANTPRCAANSSRPPRVDSQRCAAFAIAGLNSLL